MQDAHPLDAGVGAHGGGHLLERGARLGAELLADAELDGRLDLEAARDEVRVLGAPGGRLARLVDALVDRVRQAVVVGVRAAVGLGIRVGDAGAVGAGVLLVPDAVAVAIVDRAAVELGVGARRARLVGAGVDVVRDLVEVAIGRAHDRRLGGLAQADVGDVDEARGTACCPWRRRRRAPAPRRRGRRRSGGAPRPAARRSRRATLPDGWLARLSAGRVSTSNAGSSPTEAMSFDLEVRGARRRRCDRRRAGRRSRGRRWRCSRRGSRRTSPATATSISARRRWSER